MGFKIVNPPEKAKCNHTRPDSKEGSYFGPGTIWVCDDCGLAYKFLGYKHYSDPRPGESYSTDEWELAPEHNGPDNRPIAQVAMVNPASLHSNSHLGYWYGGYCR